MGQATASVRELKSRLSHYLRLTKAGESVVITERGVAIGRIVPLGKGLEARLAAMQEAGQAQWSGRKLAPMRPRPRVRVGRTVAEMLIQDRK